MKGKRLSIINRQASRALLRKGNSIFYK